MKRPFRMPLTVLPVLVFISALVIQGLILWVDTRTRVEQLHTEVEVSAQQAGLRLQTWLNDRIAIGNFLVSHVENHHTEPAQYLADAEALLNSFGGVQAINWVDPDGTIAIVYPPDGNEAALGQNLYTHPSPSVGEAIRRATATRRPSRSAATVELLQGGRGFAAYFPAERDTGELIGFINVVFRVSDVVEHCLDETFLASFRSAIVTESGEEVYSSAPGAPVGEWEWAHSTEVTVIERPMTLTIAPVEPISGLVWITWPRVVGSLGVASLLGLLTFTVLRQIERSRQSERNLVQFASSVHEVFWLASPDFRQIYYISPAYETLWGKELDDRIYANPDWWFSSVVEEDRAALEQRYREIYEGGFRENDLPLHRIRREDGAIRWLEARIYPIRNPAGEVVRIAGVDEDVTARVEADRERETLIAAIEQTAESVGITDAGGVVLYVNRAYEKTYKTTRGECVGRPAAALSDGDDETVRSTWQALEDGFPWTYQVESSGAHGPVEITEVTISPVLNDQGERTNLVIVGRDVSRELQLERQLLQSQRLESVGLLAGGVAHDFNNLLQALYGYVDLAQMHLDNPEQTASYLESMREAIERARQHVRKILLYARRAERRLEAWPVQDLVREVTNFLRPSTPSTIRFDIEVDDSCPPALISPSDIHQVLVNLCTNAFHAMPAGGVLRVRVKPREVSDTDDTWPRLAAGKYVCLTVEDTGVGIPEKDIEKIFDPYFTTKSQDEGTGLGLSVVQSVVVAHGGDVRVGSGKSQGTVFEVMLPMADDAVVPAESLSGDGRAPIQAAHVLLVDDEPTVLKVLKASLVAGGFSVDAYLDPLEALAQFHDTPEAYDLVITDQTMPNMKGLELAEHLHEERPGVPVILCSGLEPELDERPKFVNRRMTKPVRPAELIQAVRQLLHHLERV